jgi:hypothetical protein
MMSFEPALAEAPLAEPAVPVLLLLLPQAASSILTAATATAAAQRHGRLRAWLIVAVVSDTLPLFPLRD